MALSNGNKKSVDDTAFEPMALGNQTSLDADLLIAPDANEPNPSPVEDDDLIAPHPNTFFNPALVNWNWDDVIVIPSDDDEASVNEPIPLPVEDADVEDDVIVVPSDDDEVHEEEYISTSVNTQVHVKNRKHVFALIDESDSDDEPHSIGIDTNVTQTEDVNMLDQNATNVTANSKTNINSHIIDVHVDVEELARATTAKLDWIWVDLVRKEIKSLLDIVDAAEHRIESDTNVVEGLMKLILQNMKDTTKWMEQLEPYFTK
ncbi:hypothetical protein Tco_1218398 [Tanacetum coccineum]